MEDDTSVLAEQYADAENLGARIRLHEQYEVTDEPWWPWVFDRVEAAVAAATDDPAGADLLEVGCGRGDLWAENADRVPAGWTVLATDFSSGMVQTHREHTADADLQPGAVARTAAEALPFPDDCFDAVVANHMLYHTDTDRSLPELRRVLLPGGRLVATTNGEANLDALRTLLDRAGADWTPSSEAFDLQSGAEQLRAQFDAVERHDREAHLAVPDLEPLVAYAASLPGTGDPEIERFADLAADELADGPLRATKQTGAFVATVEP